MPRVNDTPATRVSPVGRYQYWGAFDAAADLPNAAAGVVETDQLEIGDFASVAGEIYLCVSSALGSASWKKVARDGGTLTTPSISGGTVSGFTTWQAVAATSGTDTAFANGTQFVSSLFVPVSFTATGIGYLIGSVGGTDKVYAVLYSAAGAVLANSSLTAGGATVGTAANVQTLAFTSTYAVTGPAMYYVGISANGATAKIRTVPAHTQGGLWGNSVAQTHGTVAAITPPTTFTADKAPAGAFLYA